MELPWFCCAVAPLLDLEKAGRVLNKPTAGGSLSLRVRRGPSVRCKTDSFALLTQRGAAADNDFEVPSPQEMGRVFRPPLRESVVPLWEGLLSRVYPCWDVHKNGNRRIAIPAEILARHADDFAAIYATLRDCLTPPRDRP
jgi:hypothetical protein